MKRQTSIFPAVLLRETSRYFEERLSNILTATSGSNATISLPEVSRRAFSIFGSWLVKQEKETRELFCFGFNFYQLKIGSGFLVESWKLAEFLDSRDFKNWLINLSDWCCNTFWPWNLWELASMVEAGFAASPLVHSMVEALAERLTQESLDLRHILKFWSMELALANASPGLLVELLTTMEDMKSLGRTELLRHSADKVCSKWHIHDTYEERKKCYPYSRNKVYSTSSSDKSQGNQNQPATTPADAKESHPAKRRRTNGAK
jgi:hypothetical protein